MHSHRLQTLLLLIHHPHPVTRRAQRPPLVSPIYSQNPSHGSSVLRLLQKFLLRPPVLLQSLLRSGQLMLPEQGNIKFQDQQIRGLF